MLIESSYNFLIQHLYSNKYKIITKNGNLFGKSVKKNKQNVFFLLSLFFLTLNNLKIDVSKDTCLQDCFFK